MGSVKVCLHSVQCEKKIENYLLADLLSDFSFLIIYLNLFNAIVTFRVCILKKFLHYFMPQNCYFICLPVIWKFLSLPHWYLIDFLKNISFNHKILFYVL